MEFIPVKTIIEGMVTQFIEKLIVTIIKIPLDIVFDNMKSFKSTNLDAYDLDRGIILKYFSIYYLQGNDMIESMNKNLNQIINKIAW
jgi:hypothetical protein